MWSKIKAFLRKLKARTVQDLYNAIPKAFAAVTSDDSRGWFKCAGYSVPLPPDPDVQMVGIIC